MFTPKVLTQEEAINLVRQYKTVISPRFNDDVQVYMYGSYSKGYANPWSDIDVAVVVPKIEGEYLPLATDLCHDIHKVSVLIEPVLLEADEPSPLYRDVMRTGIRV
ncbi:MAG: nucleotidyltransferase domain-containing protein [Bacteroidaceae bacterium]|nr:nucleotidyltransferase domain-containing protein [Bacteroidaceae bacterium]